MHSSPAEEPKAARAEGDILGHPAHPLGGGGLQDPRGIPRHGPGEHPQGDAAPEGAARLPVHARPGGVRPAVPGAVPGRGGRLPPVPGRGAIAARRRARRHARRQHAGRRDLRPADDLRQGVLSRQARRRRDDGMAARHLRAPRPDAATDGARRIQVVLVLPRRAPAGFPLGVHLGGDRRHADRCLLDAPRLRGSPSPRRRTWRRSAGDEGPLRRPGAQQPRVRRSRRPVGRRRLRARGAPRPDRRGVQQGPEAAVHDQGGRARRLRGRGRPPDRSDGLQGRAEPDLPGDLQQPDRAQGLDADDRAAVARGGEAGRAGGLAGQARRSRRDPRRLGARAVQPDARPGLGRHDRPRLRGHDPELRVRRTPVGRPDRRELERPRLADRHPRAGDPDRRLQPAGLDALGRRRGRGRLRRGGRRRGRADRPGRRGRAGRRSSRRPDTPTADSRRRGSPSSPGTSRPWATPPITPPRASRPAAPSPDAPPRPRPSWRTTSIA